MFAEEFGAFGLLFWVKPVSSILGFVQRCFSSDARALCFQLPVALKPPKYWRVRARRIGRSVGGVGACVGGGGPTGRTSPPPPTADQNHPQPQPPTPPHLNKLPIPSVCVERFELPPRRPKRRMLPLNTIHRKITPLKGFSSYCRNCESQSQWESNPYLRPDGRRPTIRRCEQVTENLYISDN